MCTFNYVSLIVYNDINYCEIKMHSMLYNCSFCSICFFVLSNATKKGDSIKYY